jgi:hypothetical protein
MVRYDGSTMAEETGPIRPEADLSTVGGRPSADAAPTVSDEPAIVEPSADEVEAWAAQETQRRQAWLRGPTESEKASWARGERGRRIAELGPEARAAELARLSRRYGRETQLIAEGAMSLFLTWSRRAIAELVRAGREWEEEATRPPARRRIPLDDEDR